MFVKYPRTFHLPYSEGVQSDDKIIKNKNIFDNKEVVVTIKMDGENSTLYQNHCHARSIDSLDHPSRHWLKSFHHQISYLIPESYRICGENLFAKHSIQYSHLDSYFLAFSVWHNDLCLSWEETEVFLKNLNIEIVPVIYKGTFDKTEIFKAYQSYCDEMKTKYNEEVEGFVVRLSDSFNYNNFESSVAKYVRANHVQTKDHWMHSQISTNFLKKQRSKK